jgi:hypothetical protein
VIGQRPGLLPDRWRFVGDATLRERPKNPVDGIGLFVKFPARLTDLEQQAYYIYCNGTLRLAANAF